MAERQYTPRLRTANCANCGSEFSYLHSNGTLRQHCGERCRAQFRLIKRQTRKVTGPPCGVLGCTGHASRVSAGLCEKHYMRRRRGMPDGDKVPAYRYLSGAGYVILLDKSHPLSDRDGRVAEHRTVMYGHHGATCPDCYWCGKALTWEDAVVDHLDEDKQNNLPGNLAVACNACNRARGAILPFIRSLRTEALLLFVDLAEKYHARRNP